MVFDLASTQHLSRDLYHVCVQRCAYLLLFLRCSVILRLVFGILLASLFSFSLLLGLGCLRSQVLCHHRWIADHPFGDWQPIELLSLDSNANTSTYKNSQQAWFH
jgi:cell division protein FtsW (lipid II flippase)